MNRLVLGTAGHIDHGKTELIRALTGVDTDRLPDEKRRGITIDLGFARLDAGSNVELSIVDVPGHEDFIRNMVAGATGMDLVLMVVAADEGIMPQTREHLAVIDLLGVSTGVVAITKTDLVEPEWLELVIAEAGETLAATSLAAAPILPVSSVTGAGVTDIREAITAAADHTGSRTADDLFRLPVDRVFTVRGTGTVVTGTVWSGRLTTNDSVRALPAGGNDIVSRVRGLQVHGRDTKAVHAGERAAVALVGVDRDALSRGDTLVRDPAWRTASMVTVRMRVLGSAGSPIRHRQRLRLHLGTAEVMARAVPLDGREIMPGEDGLAQLRLEAPIAARAGDPFVIRSYSPVMTIGGGRVIEPAARKRKRIGAKTGRLLNEIIAGSAESAVGARARLDGLMGSPCSRLPLDTPHAPAVIRSVLTHSEEEAGVTRAGDLLFADGVAEEIRERLLSRVRAHHARNPLEPGMDREALLWALPEYAADALGEHALATLIDQSEVRHDSGTIAEAGFSVRLDGEQARFRAELLAHIREAGLEAPSAAELPDGFQGMSELEDLLTLLVREGELVRIPGERYLAQSVLEDAIRRLYEAFPEGTPASPSEIKRVLPVTRKYLMPLLGYLDNAGITVRRDGGRIVRRDSSAA